MILKVVGCSFDIVLAPFLIEEESQLKSRLCLRLSIEWTVGDVEHFAQILDRHACISIFAFTLSQTLVSLPELVLVFIFDADLEKTIQIFDGTLHLVLSLVNQGDLLVALSFFDGVMCTARNIQTLLEELKTKFSFAFLIVFNCN